MYTIHYNPCKRDILQTIKTRFATHYNPCKQGLLLTTTHVNEVCYSLQPM